MSEIIGDPVVYQGLVRQRRSLLVTSLALLAFQGIGARIEKLSLLGNEIVLNQPLALSLPLWIAWAYFLLRYYQYFRDLRSSGLKDACQLGENRLYMVALKQQLAADIEVTYRATMKRPSATVAYAHMDMQSSPPRPLTYHIRDGQVVVRDRAGSGLAVQMLTSMEFEVKRIPRAARMRGIIWAMLHTRLGTEFVLPFVVAAVPVVAALVRLAFAWA